jgi:DNA gyrase subunit A
MDEITTCSASSDAGAGDDIILDELARSSRSSADKLGRPRSVIEHHAPDLETEDLITPTDMVVTLSHAGYIKSQPLTEYRAQRRGGRGKQAAQTKEDDWIDQLFIANSHDWILCFTSAGRVYWLKVWEVPQGSRNSRGRPIVNMFPLQADEKVNVVLPLTGAFRSFPASHTIFMATQQGTVKKTGLDEFSNPRKAGIIAVDLDPGDRLIGAALTDGTHDVMLFSDGGKAVRFDEQDVRAMGRGARGVRGMALEPSPERHRHARRGRRVAERPDRHREMATASAPASSSTRGTAAARRG